MIPRCRSKATLCRSTGQIVRQMIGLKRQIIIFDLTLNGAGGNVQFFRGQGAVAFMALKGAEDGIVFYFGKSLSGWIHRNFKG